jgi:Histidine kinase
MSKHSENWNSKWLLVAVSSLFGSYVGISLFRSLTEQYAHQEAGFSGFWHILVGFLVGLGGVGLLAWLNFRGPFQWWFLTKTKQNLYYIWLLLLALGVFELLQVRTGYDLVFVDENWLVTLVFMTITVVFSYVADAFRVRRERLLLEQQKTRAELTALQAQVNPHFLFNALNTIYNEADAAQNDHVAELVQQLAGILRFTLQEAQKDFTSVAHEIGFIEKYLALQRARLPKHENISIETHIEYDEQPARIAPLLLIPFIENAFQYGISMQQRSFIRLHLNIESGVLWFQIENSILPQNTHKRGHGTGIINAKKRLKLLYNDQHQLDIQENSNRFEIKLRIVL